MKWEPARYDQVETSYRAALGQWWRNDCTESGETAGKPSPRHLACHHQLSIHPRKCRAPVASQDSGDLSLFEVVFSE